MALRLGSLAAAFPLDLELSVMCIQLEVLISIDSKPGRFNCGCGESQVENGRWRILMVKNYKWRIVMNVSELFGESDVGVDPS